ncbi:hypothetical protein [Actinomadura xylanilytica]|uniref:hypothetical protein n=1 Tax=Actinomadura xylanilytica TaxID=887459 RepID=UPI00255AAC67|nr:hypothetical protein [Actinomadura xylanilytica]MDL4774530.1 hypothetical protein [Actinomadura xylanilytica]
MTFEAPATNDRTHTNAYFDPLARPLHASLDGLQITCDDPHVRGHIAWRAAW